MRQALSSMVFGFVVSTAAVALAGSYSDEMGKCLVKWTSEGDRTTLVRWIFASATLHPAVKSLASISDAERVQLDRSVAKLMERLLTESCPTETQTAVWHEGASALKASFSVLGRVAMEGLMADPNVVGGMSGIARYVDEEKLQKVLGPMQ